MTSKPVGKKFAFEEMIGGDLFLAAQGVIMIICFYDNGQLARRVTCQRGSRRRLRRMRVLSLGGADLHFWGPALHFWLLLLCSFMPAHQAIAAAGDQPLMILPIERDSERKTSKLCKRKKHGYPCTT